MNSSVAILFFILLILYFSFAFILFIIGKVQHRKCLFYLFFSLFLRGFHFIGPALLMFNIDNSWTGYLIGPVKVMLTPLTYLYVQKIADTDKSFKKEDLWHFIPLFINVILAIILVPGHAYEFVGHRDETIQSTLKMIWENNPRRNIMVVSSRIFSFLQALVYPVLVYRLYKKYITAIKNNSSLLKSTNSVWIKWVILIVFAEGFFQGFGLLGIYNYSFILTLTYGFLIFYAFFFFVHALLQEDISIIFSHENMADRNAPVTIQKKESKKIIKLFMEKELYLNPDVSLQELAVELGVAKYKLTKIIKDEGFDNFYVFVNHYRIEKSKKLLSEIPGNRVIESIIEESGFNSRATFYRVFKESTGLTPKEFISKIHRN